MNHSRFYRSPAGRSIIIWYYDSGNPYFVHPADSFEYFEISLKLPEGFQVRDIVSFETAKGQIERTFGFVSIIEM